MGALHIPKTVLESLRAHGEETYPHECCGALLGQPGPYGWSITSAVRAANTSMAPAHNRYSIAPAELVAIARDARRQSLEIAGFYHSHPDHAAHWSSTDLAEAHWIGCCYVITEVALGRATQTNSFLLAGTTEEDKRFELQRIQITS